MHGYLFLALDRVQIVMLWPILSYVCAVLCD